MQYRWATSEDYVALVRIAAASAPDNEDAAARGHGFLTGHFDAAKFAAFAIDLGVLVAEDAGALAGFLCASTVAFMERTPILAAMLAAARGVTFDGRALGAYRLFGYGPVCIAPAYQGRHVFRGLYVTLLRELAGRFDVGILFVDAGNAHSLDVHERGLGMTRVGRFSFHGRSYFILVFRCASDV